MLPTTMGLVGMVILLLDIVAIVSVLLEDPRSCASCSGLR